LIACLWIGSPSLAHAQAAPSTLVIAAATKPGSPLAEVHDAIREALEKLDGVRLLPPSPLDLDAVQLAIECPDTSARCLREIATLMDAEIVLVPSIKTKKDALELRVTCFKADARSAPATAMRKQAGTRLDATLLDAVPGMLREVLELEDARVVAAVEPEDKEPDEEHESETQAPAEEPVDTQASTGQPQGAHSDFPLGPVLVGSGGVALLATGIVLGAIASSTEDDYASYPIDTEQQASAADALRAKGESQALAANILLGTGAAAIVVAGIWYIATGQTERAPTHATLRPLLGPHTAGLMLAGPWEQLP
jgi:hypothetical protein